MTAPRHLIGLDLVRFAAAFLVAAYHLGLRVGPVQSWTSFGWVGVELFFALSGFVIAYTAQTTPARAFAQARAVRLLPAVWICATLILAVKLATGAEVSFLTYLRSLVLWPFSPWIASVFWTLPVEVAFYGLVWVVLALGQRPRLPAVLMALGTLSTAYWVTRLAPAPFHVALPASVFGLRFLLLKHGCFFALGGLLWAILLDRATALRLVSAAVFGVTGLAYIASISDGRHGSTPLAPLLAFALTVAAIVASVKFNRSSRLARGLRLLGLTTYPLYLLHTTVGLLVLKALTPSVPIVAAFLISLAVSIAVALPIAAFAEPWLQQKLRTALGALRRGPPVAAQLSG